MEIIIVKDEDLTAPCKRDEGFRRIDIKEETGWCHECGLDCPLAEKRKILASYFLQIL